MDRAHLLGDAALRARVPQSRRVRRPARPHRDARARVRRAHRHAVLSYGAWAPRRTAGPYVRAGARARAEGEADLDLDEPAEAERAPSVDRELPERARPLDVPVPAQ